VLGILRRPAGSADALPTGLASYWENDRSGRYTFEHYIRRAASAFGSTYYVIPTLAPRCKPAQPLDAVQLVGSTAHGWSLANVKWGDQIDALGLLGMASGGTFTVLAMIVPDGVARVSIRESSPRMYKVTASARNNVAVLPIPDGYPDLYRATMTWHDPRGRVVKTFSHV
jgi:hypothetical protein